VPRTTFKKAKLAYCRFKGCDLTDADLYNADLGSAEIRDTALANASLRFAILTFASFAKCDLRGANLHRAWVYGMSAWDVITDETTMQDELGIDPERHPWLAWDRHLPQVTAQGVEFAHLIGLLRHSASLGRLLDAVSGKMVLILGRFRPERLEVLTAIQEHLRSRDRAPVIFNFEPPDSKSLTETVRILGGMSGLVVADLTDPKSVPQELMALVPSFPGVPVVPLLEGEEDPYSMFPDFFAYQNVRPLIRYPAGDAISADVVDEVLEAARRQPAIKDLLEDNRALRARIEELEGQ